MDNIKKSDATVKIRCLVFRSTDEDAIHKWSAVGLEVDVWGFGNSREEASSDLDELLEAHVEFATGRNEPEILDHRTDEKWFKLWDELNGLGEDTMIQGSSAKISTSLNESAQHDHYTHAVAA